MLIRVGLEYIVKERILAWGLDFPGCFAYGSDDADVMMHFTRNLLEFEEWVALHADEPWFQLVNMDFRIVEAYKNVQQTGIGSSEESTAFFEDDLRPLAVTETQNVLNVFRWQREELLNGLEYLPEELLTREKPGLGGTILDSLRQLARMEHYYLSCFNPHLPSFQEGRHPFDELEASSVTFEKLLSELTEKAPVLDVKGELWSPRKLARRLLWQQRVRIDEIKALAGV
ncbi:MAG TPA: hypothetical protein PL025_04345 [Anaerolineaceae bacterium]|nr:hypothetical protein [Anaerolineaceae bacterium]